MNAGVIVHARAWLLDEEVADFECLVGEVTGFPDRKAGWIAVPVFIGFGDVSHIVDLLAGVVLVYVFSVALEVVAAVLYAPKPVTIISSQRTYFTMSAAYMLFLSKQIPTSLRCPYPALYPPDT